MSPPPATPPGLEADPAGALLLFELQQPQSTATPDRPTLPESREDVRWVGSFSRLYQTPPALRPQLTDYQVALWRRAGTWALSTSRASVLLAESAGAGPGLDFTTYFPARGGGYLTLSAGELTLFDRYESPGLAQLLAALLACTAATARYLEAPDCQRRAGRWRAANRRAPAASRA